MDSQESEIVSVAFDGKQDTSIGPGKNITEPACLPNELANGYITNSGPNDTSIVFLLNQGGGQAGPFTLKTGQSLNFESLPLKSINNVGTTTTLNSFYNKLGYRNQKSYLESLKKSKISVTNSFVGLSYPMIPVGPEIFNTPIAANTNFYAANIVPRQTPCLFRIYVSLSASGIVSVQRTNGGVTVSEPLNGGTPVNAAAYIFDIIVNAGDSINLQTNTAAQINSCSVSEIDNASAA